MMPCSAVLLLKMYIGPFFFFFVGLYKSLGSHSTGQYWFMTFLSLIKYFLALQIRIIRNTLETLIFTNTHILLLMDVQIKHSPTEYLLALRLRMIRNTLDSIIATGTHIYS